MPLILAIEPDRRQAAQLTGVIRRVGAELLLANTTEHALDAIGSRVPDLVLVPALLSPQDDAALAAALRVIAAAAHVRILTTPVLGITTKRKSPGGVLAKWRRGGAESLATDGCDPAVFGDQISDYLKEAAAERAEREAAFDPSAQYHASAAREAVFDPSAEYDLPDDVSEPTEQMPAASQPLEAPACEELAPAIEAASFEPAPAEPIEVEPVIAEPAPVVEPVLPGLIVETSVPPLVYEEEMLAFAATDVTARFDDVIDLSDQLLGVSADAALETFFDDEPVEAHAVASAPQEVASEVFDLLPDVDPLVSTADEELWTTLSYGAGRSWPRLEGVQSEAAPEVLEPEEAAVLARPEPVPVVRPPEPAPIAIVAKPKAPPADGVPKEAAVVARPQPVPAVRPPAQAPVVVIASKPKAPQADLASKETSVVARPQPLPVVRPPAPTPVVVGVAKPKAPQADLAPKSKQAAVVARPQSVPAVRPPAPAPIVAAAKRQEWLELIDSLRLDVDRLRTGRDHAVPVVSATPKEPVVSATPKERRAPAPAPASAAKKPTKRTKKAKPIQDEWGFFDPEQCGFAALLAKLDEITEAAEEPDFDPKD